MSSHPIDNSLSSSDHPRFTKKKSSEEDTFPPQKFSNKIFRSRKALFIPMKCHFGNGKLEEDSFESQLDDEAETLLCKRKRSNKKKRYTKVGVNSSPSVSDSIVDREEQEEVAMSLIILSGDKGNRGGSSAEFLEAEKVAANKALKFKKLYFETKSEFKCSVCRKSFPSYQALGGHRASHKKFNGCCTPRSESRASHKKFNGCCAPRSESGSLEAKSSRKRNLIGCKKKEHECPICFKVVSVNMVRQSNAAELLGITMP